MAHHQRRNRSETFFHAVKEILHGSCFLEIHFKRQAAGTFRREPSGQLLVDSLVRTVRHASVIGSPVARSDLITVFRQALSHRHSDSGTTTDASHKCNGSESWIHFGVAHRSIMSEKNGGRHDPSIQPIRWPDVTGVQPRTGGLRQIRSS